MDRQKIDRVVNTVFSLFQERITRFFDQESDSWMLRVAIPANTQSLEIHSWSYNPFREIKISQKLETEDIDPLTCSGQVMTIQFGVKPFKTDPCIVQAKKQLALALLDTCFSLEALTEEYVDILFREVVEMASG